MKRVILLLMTFAAILFTSAAAQNCKVSGVVADAAGETIPYATIAAAQDDKVVRRVAANADGAFAIELTRGEAYVITVSSVGYAPYTCNLDVPRGATCDMGTLLLSADTRLAEVVIEAQKPIIKSDAEKITYDVSADPEADSKMLIEMLRKVPMVTVDAEDNIQLNGSSNFKVLVNGKESVMLTNNLKEVMKSMPASSVQDIQVITNPSSRYDAEGTGGIINIITTRDKLEGLTGSVAAYADILGSFGGNVYLATQYKRFTVSLNYSGGRNRNKQYSQTDIYNYNNPDVYHSTVRPAEEYFDINSSYHFFGLESSFEMDSLNLFTLGITGSLGNYGINSDYLNRTYAQSGALMSHYIDHSVVDGMWGGVAANFDYQHTFGKPGHTFTASYRYEYNPNDGSYADSILVDANTLNAPYEGQRNKNNSHAQEHTVQIDYVNPVAEHHSVEAGAKLITRLNSSDDDYAMLYGNVWQPAGRQQSLSYTQRVAAVYAGYAYTATNWGVRGGARYEETWIDATLQQAGVRTDFGKPYGNFVPYVSVNYNVDPMQSFRLSYTQRINRPGISLLSPYENRVASVQVQYGNPNLRPDVSHNVSAAYSLFKGTFNLNLQWDSRIVNNSIESYTFVDPSTGVIHSTYDNIGKSQTHGLSAYISGQPSSKFSYYANLGARYVFYESPSLQLENDGWIANASLGCQWTAWKGGTISFNGGIGSPWISLQRESTTPWYYYGLGITQRFFDDKLKISLSGTNFFNRNMTYNAIFKDKDYSMYSEGGYMMSNVQFSVSFTFGKLDAQVKKVNRSIVNDDEVSRKEGAGMSRTPR